MPFRNIWQIGYGEETTYGTPVARTDWLGIVQNFSGEIKRNLSQLYHGNLREPFKLVKGQKDIAISLEMFPQNGKFLKYVFGKVTTTGTGPYTHTIEIDNALPSITLEAAHTQDNFAEVYAGVKANRLQVDAAVGDPLKFSLDLIAKDVEKSATVTTLTEITTDPYTFEQGVVYVDGVQVANAKSLSFSFENGLAPIFVLGSDELANLLAKRIKYSVSLELVPEDSTYFDMLVADTLTEFDAYILFTRGANDTIKFLFNNCKVDTGKIPKTTGEENVVQTLDFLPKNVQVEVVDNISTY